MDPTDLRELLVDDSPAFRVSFDGPLPERSKLYWRGPVLTQFDGKVWSRVRHVADAPRSTPSPRLAMWLTTKSRSSRSDRRWLLALDVPLGAPENASRAADMSLVAAKLRQRAAALSCRSATALRQLVRSSAIASATATSQLSRVQPACTGTGAQWRKDSGGDDNAVIRAALDLFHTATSSTFVVPEPGRNAVDDFLFETHTAGFCQHYSLGVYVPDARGRHSGARRHRLTRAATSMRSATTSWCASPTRTPGRRCGSSGRGWVRVDPTGGGESRARRTWRARRRPAPASQWYRPDWLAALRNQFDLVNRAWNSAIVQFNMLRQQSLLDAVRHRQGRLLRPDHGS